MFIPKRKIRIWRRKHQWQVIFYLASFVIGFIIGVLAMIHIDMVKASPEPIVMPIFEATTAPKPTKTPIVGKASYYSVDGCIGCREDRAMANGQRLDDTRLTVAYNHAPLNTWIEITNTDTNQTVRVQVTDRGGFEAHGKIVDLSVATRDAIGCGDVCNIKIDLQHD